MPRKLSRTPQERHARKRTTGPPHLIIGHSRIDTEGCYTTEFIKQGSFVVEYTGPRLTIKEADALYDNHPRTYLFGLSNGKQVIDGNGVGAFINHSCDPNCEIEEVDGRVLITAIRDIMAGEELTYDYNLYDGELDDPSLCFCGAKNCRGTMYSEEEIKRRMRVLKQRAGRTTKTRKA